MKNDRDYINILYQAFLGRDADEVGANYFLDKIKKNRDLRYVIDSLISSDEFISKQAYKKSASNIFTQAKPYLWLGQQEEFLRYGSRGDITSILIVCLDHIGDFFLTVDALNLLRKSYPESSLDLLCGKWNTDLAKSLNIFNSIYNFNFFCEKSGNKDPTLGGDFLNLIVGQNYDLLIDFRIQSDTREVFNYIEAKYKCGFVSERYSNLDVALEPVLSRNNQLSQSHHRMQKLRLVHSIVDFFNFDSNMGEFISASINNIASVASVINPKNIEVSIHPFSGKEIKNWPIDNYLEIINFLSENFGATVNILGSQLDMPYLSSFSKIIENTNVNILIGSLSLIDSIATIGKSDLFIGNDSGLAHAAARMNIPTIAIFSGVDLPEFYAPYGANVSIVKYDTDCSPCYKKSIASCENNLKCLESIDVFAIKNLIETKVAEIEAAKTK